MVSGLDATGLQAIQIHVLNILRRRLHDELQLVVFVETVRILTESAIGRTARGLDVDDIPRLRPQHSKKGLRVHRPSPNFQIVRLVDDRTARRPEVSQFQNEFL